MRIAVIGIGGVGGYFGGKIAKAGFETTFIARAAHLEAIQQHGLQVKSINGNFIARPTVATDDLNACSEADLILLCTKSWQVSNIAQRLKQIIDPECMVLPLQNGADNEEKLLEQLSKGQVLGGLCRIISYIESPGVIHHPAFHPQVIFGELNNERSSRVEAIKQVFDKADFDSVVAEDIWRAVWQKFLFIATISGMGGLTRVEIGKMRSDDHIRDLMLKTAKEIVAIAKAKSISLSESDITKAFAAIDEQDPSTTASMQRDIMAGRPSELEEFNGYIAKEGKRLGVPTPANEMIYRLLLPQEEKARN